MSSRSVKIPEGVDVEIDGFNVRVEGPLGRLTKDFSHVAGRVSIGKTDREVVVEIIGKPRRKKLALIGTVAAHIRNMLIGVTKGFTYRLKIVYAHFPVSIRVKDGYVIIENFLGERSPRFAKMVGDVEIITDRDDVVVKGIDIEAVGQTAANIENATRVKGKDPRIFLDGIYVYRKEVGM